MTLQDYITDVQRLLHDASGNFWTTDELTSYINEGRKRTVTDTGCNRTTRTGVGYNFVAAQESMTLATDIINVLDIYIQWWNVRWTLKWASWPTFNRDYRQIITWQDVPQIWSMQGRKVFNYPVSNDAYVSEWDVIPLPTTLVNSTDVDNDIFFPYTRLPSLWAAYLAKIKEQSQTEAEMFRNLYFAEGTLGTMAPGERRM